MPWSGRELGNEIRAQVGVEGARDDVAALEGRMRRARLVLEDAGLSLSDEELIRAMKESDPLQARARPHVERMNRVQQIAVSMVASPKVVRKAQAVTILALEHLSRRLREEDLDDLVKDRLAKIALDLAPKAVAAVRSLVETVEGNLPLPSGPSPDALTQASAPTLPADAQRLIESSRQIVARHGK